MLLRFKVQSTEVIVRIGSCSLPEAITTHCGNHDRTNAKAGDINSDAMNRRSRELGHDNNFFQDFFFSVEKKIHKRSRTWFCLLFDSLSRRLADSRRVEFVQR